MTKERNRISALLRKASDNGVTEHERQALLTKAAELAARVGLGLEDFEGNRTDPHHDPGQLDIAEYTLGRWAKLNGMFVHSAARNLGAFTVRYSRSGGGTIKVFGRTRVIDRVVRLADTAWTEANIALARSRLTRPRNVHMRTWTHSFLLGYLAEWDAILGRQVGAVTKQAAMDGTNLPVLSSLSSEARRFAESLDPGITKGSPTRAGTAAGYHAGAAAARRANTTTLTGGRAALGR